VTSQRYDCVKMNSQTIFLRLPCITLLAMFTITACSKKASPFVGTYRCEVRDTAMGEELTRIDLKLEPDGTASLEARATGQLVGIGTTSIDLLLAGEGTWKDAGTGVEVSITIKTWNRNGKSLTAAEPVKLTVEDAESPRISVPVIKSKEGVSFVPPPLFPGAWTHDPVR
jgi:hypothetical protein